MKKKYTLTVALIIAIIASFGFLWMAASAQSGGSSAGPTAQNCYSAQFPAASGCDMVNSMSVAIPATGGSGNVVAGASLSVAPTIKDCYSAKFHAASDCDRLSSQ